MSTTRGRTVPTYPVTGYIGTVKCVRFTGSSPVKSHMFIETVCGACACMCMRAGGLTHVVGRREENSTLMHTYFIYKNEYDYHIVL